MSAETSLVWLRDDLRLADNPALRAAVDRGGRVAVLYVLDEESPGIRPLGGAARWWLHGSLASLAERLRERGSTLGLRRGPAAAVRPQLLPRVRGGGGLSGRRLGAGAGPGGRAARGRPLRSAETHGRSTGPCSFRWSETRRGRVRQGPGSVARPRASAAAPTRRSPSSP